MHDARCEEVVGMSWVRGGGDDLRLRVIIVPRWCACAPKAPVASAGRETAREWGNRVIEVIEGSKGSGALERRVVGGVPRWGRNLGIGRSAGPPEHQVSFRAWALGFSVTDWTLLCWTWHTPKWT